MQAMHTRACIREHVAWRLVHHVGNPSQITTVYHQQQQTRLPRGLILRRVLALPYHHSEEDVRQSLSVAY